MINSPTAERLISRGKKVLHINTREYCDFPYGRTVQDSPDSCGTLFRESVLIPAIKANPDILILDFSAHIITPSASWVDEIFKLRSSYEMFLTNHLVVKESHFSFTTYFLKNHKNIVLKKQSLFEREFLDLRTKKVFG
ncbi:hypothetical protein XaC1_231 [Xanthomonas phage XaC1]|nr:hypothetical protein XaC1_231 [Xanthomonas phage XaC1]